VLILGTLAVDAATANLAYSVYLYILMALAVLASFFAPIACAAALRIALD
jgi:heme exporter protein B